MRAVFVSMCLIGLLSGCISSSNPSPPAKTTVVVPPSNGSTVVVPPSNNTTVVCQDGTRPPCN
jgi:ABC-type Fe3+-hydroxamate transport system substrate-binding protein